MKRLFPGILLCITAAYFGAQMMRETGPAYRLQIVSWGGNAYTLDSGMTRGDCLQAMRAAPDSECVREARP